MELIFLGTSCMVPTKERNVSGVYLDFANEGMLFDCGEGTQRQMNIAGIKRTSITRIFISHWHGDHVSGLIGLLQTIGNEDGGKPIHIYGPKGSEARAQAMIDAFFYTEKIDIIVHELNPLKLEKCIDADDFEVFTAPLDHGIPCIGFRLVEKKKLNIDKAKMQKLKIPEGPHLASLKLGKSIQFDGKTFDPKEICTETDGRIFTYIADTEYCKNALDLAENADVVISESTYAHDLVEKAKEYHHLTAQEAAQIANHANAKRLYLTHFSQRYRTVEQIEDEAKMIFPNAICAKDFMKIKIEKKTAISLNI